MLYSIALVSAIRFVCVGLCCSNLGEVGLFSVTVYGLLTAAASLVEHRLQGVQAQ